MLLALHYSATVLSIANLLRLAARVTARDRLISSSCTLCTQNHDLVTSYVWHYFDLIFIIFLKVSILLISTR